MNAPQSKVANENEADANGAVAGSALGEVDWPALRQAVISYVVRRGQARHIAEDVAQDTCAALVEFLKDQRPGSLYALAFHIASKRLADHVRKDFRFTGEIGPDHVSEEPLPDQVVDNRLALAAMERAMAKMPAMRREVIIRRRLDRQPHSRIAMELGLSLASVEKHVTRGMADLRRALAQASRAGRVRR